MYLRSPPAHAYLLAVDEHNRRRRRVSLSRLDAFRHPLSRFADEEQHVRTILYMSLYVDHRFLRWLFDLARPCPCNLLIF